MRDPSRWITAKTTVRALAAHPIVDSITPLELVVYLRVVASADGNGVSIATNGELKPGHAGDPRPIVAAIRRLAERGLLKIHYVGGSRSLGRSIEVLR
jgi:hypothetical protein